MRQPFVITARNLLLLVSLVCLLGCPGSNSSKPPATPTADTGADTGADKATELDPAKGTAISAGTSDAAEESRIASPGTPPAAGDASPGSAATADSASPPAEYLAGEWTKRRLVALAAGGPTIVDIAISVDGQDLATVSESVAAEMAAEIFAGLEAPVQWKDLLNQPLIQSGWLGNLVAEEDQVDQLISMYDRVRDDIATVEELGPFLSRGLSRNDPLQITDIGVAPDATPNQSPWGELDSNEDYVLSRDELQNIGRAVLRFDYNGDSVVTLQEVNQSRAMAMQDTGAMQRSLLDANTLFVAEDIDATDETVMNKAVRRLSNAILGHYTFLDGVPRDSWVSWSDARWSLLDNDADASLSRRELEQVATLAADLTVYCRFPSLNQADQELWLWCESATTGGGRSWNRSKLGGRMTTTGFVGEVAIEDVFGRDGRRVLRQRLEAAFKDTQLQSFFAQQLQLKDIAFGLLDADEDQQLSDEEFESAWRWLTARQGSRVLARWMTAARPWFQMLDANGDSRLTEMELIDAEGYLASLDRNEDQELTPNEMPLLVRMEVNRSDSRLGDGLFAGLPGPDGDSADFDWFSAMDTNADGYVSSAEFLGEFEDFDSLDSDKDGFLARTEVYAP